MGAPCATSTTTQATTTRAAELVSVRMACAQAIHTKSLLQDLQLDQPMSLRVLTGGPLAMQVGLSRKSRHLDLWSRFGQFQLSKVTPQQNLAAALTNNHTASGLHRLLPKLKMHTRSAEALALSTGLGRGPAFFRSRSSSFFIGVLRKPPAMAQLVTAKELLGKETEKTINIPELASASISETSLRQKGLAAAASTTEMSLQQKELAWLEAFKPQSSTRASSDQLDALQESGFTESSPTRASSSSTNTKPRTRASYSLMTTSLLSIFLFILMVRILTLPSLSLPSSLTTDSFINC